MHKSAGSKEVAPNQIPHELEMCCLKAIQRTPSWQRLNEVGREEKGRILQQIKILMEISFSVLRLPNGGKKSTFAELRDV